MEFTPPALDTLSVSQLGSVRQVLSVLVAYCDQRTLMLQAGDADIPVFEEKLKELYGRLPEWARWKQPAAAPKMWEPFSKKAREAIVRAQGEAQRLQSSYIGSEHLLLGVLAVGPSLLANPERVRQAVEAQVIAGQQRTDAVDLVFSPVGRKVIEIAFEEARRVRANLIEAEHLLIALAQAGGLGTRVLAALSLDHDTLRWALDNGKRV